MRARIQTAGPYWLFLHGLFLLWTDGSKGGARLLFIIHHSSQKGLTKTGAEIGGIVAEEVIAKCG